MTKALIFLTLLFVSSCATKYVLPGNRFITPESQGGSGEGHFELQQADATAVETEDQKFVPIESRDPSGNGPLGYKKFKRMGYSLATSIYDSLDFYWSHTGTSVSLLGLKLQALGASRSGKGAGNKIALTAAVGGNEYDRDAWRDVDFSLNATDFSLIHGYRFNEFAMVYETLSMSVFNYKSTISSDDYMNGTTPSYTNKLMGLYVGGEFTYSFIISKLELGYQTITSTNTKKKNNILLGYSLGFSW